MKNMTENNDNTLKLKSFLSLVRNKNNKQFSFVIKKRMFNAFHLTPSNILNMTIPKKYDKQKTIKIIKPVYKSK